jgi:hypothetical protein
MTDKTYNGWTNYATWRVNLEIFDGIDPREMGWTGLEPYDLAPILRDYVEEVLESELKQSSEFGFVIGYALAFLEEVNYREIATMLLEAYAEEAA